MTTPSIDTGLLLAHRDWLRRLAFQLVRDQAAADDLVQETWMTALERRRSPASPTRPWLAGVLRNKALGRLRAERRRVRREGEAARTEAQDDEPGRTLEALEVGQQLTERVLALSPPLRDAIVLRYYHDRSPRSIARELGVPESTIRTRLARALQRLRDDLDADCAGHERWCSALSAFALGNKTARMASALGPGTWLAAGLLAAGAACLLALSTWGDPDPLQTLPQPDALLALAEPARPVRLLPDATTAPPVAAQAEPGTPRTASRKLDASPPDETRHPRMRTMTGQAISSEIDGRRRPRVFFAYLTGATIQTIDAQVDASGRFVLETTQAAAGRLVAVAGGTRPASIDLERGESRENARLVLEPGATISGTVTSVGARVALRAARTTEQPTFTPRSSTDALAWGEERIEWITGRAISEVDGRFELSGLEPGPHAISVQPIYKNSRRPRGTNLDTPPRPLRYTASPHIVFPAPEEAARIVVAPASEVELSSAVRGVIVRVLDGGQPLEQFYCQASSHPAPLRMTDGELHVRFHPDSPGSLRLWFPGYEERELRFPEDLPAEGGDASGELVVELARTSPPVELSLHLSGAVPDRVAVEVRERDRGSLPFLIQRELDVVGNQVRVGGLAPGPATLRLGPVPDPDAPSDIVAIEREIVVERGPVPLELTLARGGRVELVVHKDTPGPVAVGAFASLPGSLGTPLQVGTSSWRDGDRLQHAAALAPGRYLLTFRWGAGRAQSLPDAMSFEIRQGEVTRVDVRFQAD